LRAVVIGGGWAGALAARELACGMGMDVVIVESAERPGGLLRSESVNGFTFDTGGSHVLFSRNEAELGELLGLLGDNLAAHERRSFARLRGHTVPYPVENGISELPAELRAELGAGLAGALANPPPDGWRPSSFLEWIERTFGEPLARDYMIPYNRKIWKRSLEDMDAGWVHIPGRLPIPSLEDVCRAVAGIRTVGYAEQSRFHYPGHGGIQALYDAALGEAARCGARVLAGEEARTIERRGGLWSVNGRVEGEIVVNTAPLGNLVGMLDAPGDVEMHAKALERNGVIVVGVALGREAPSGAHWTYVPDEGVVFHRYAWISNYSPENAPPGRSSILAEITVPPGAEVDLDGAAREAVEGLVELGVIREGDVLFARAWFHEYGYPVYLKGHDEHRRAVLEYLSGLGIISVGRWGQWHYWNMDAVHGNVKKEIRKLLRDS